VILEKGIGDRQSICAKSLSFWVSSHEKVKPGQSKIIWEKQVYDPDYYHRNQGQYSTGENSSLSLGIHLIRQYPLNDSLCATTFIESVQRFDRSMGHD